MESGGRGVDWRALLRSAGRPLHVLLLLLSVVLLADPPVFYLGVLGLVLLAALVWRDVQGQAGTGGIGEAEEDVDAPPIHDAYSAQTAAAEAIAARIRAALMGADRPMARVLAPIRVQVDRVLERLVGLVGRAQRIERFLSREKREDIEKGVATLVQQSAASTDPFVREQYEQARRAREQQLRDYDELCLCLERVRAQIANVLSSLEAAEARVERLQVADLRLAGQVSDDVTRSLQALSQEMTGFQESIDAIVALRAR